MEKSFEYDDLRGRPSAEVDPSGHAFSRIYIISVLVYNLISFVLFWV